MNLSDIGVIIDEEWRKTELIRPYVTLDRYVIMPDHFHGIITIRHRDDAVETPCHGVSTNNQKWKPGCLGAVIHQFKRACTVRIRATGCVDFAWQPRFHDSIIRDDRALENIRMYIANNPAQWKNAIK